jgi:hypothetical protein
MQVEGRQITVDRDDIDLFNRMLAGDEGLRSLFIEFMKGKISQGEYQKGELKIAMAISETLKMLRCPDASAEQW